MCAQLLPVVAYNMLTPHTLFFFLIAFSERPERDTVKEHRTTIPHQTIMGMHIYLHRRFWLPQSLSFVSLFATQYVLVVCHHNVQPRSPFTTIIR
jgi:hypothetical protein